jgi:hypothetical protein
MKFRFHIKQLTCSAFFILLVNIVVVQNISAQNSPKATVQDIVNSVTKLAETQAIEKLYIQTDKPFYAVNDTLWFKAYLFNAAFLSASVKSGILYVEVANEQNTVVKRFMVSLYVGLGWGNIALSEKEFPQGNYCLRAYTSWMRNFDEHYIFKKQFYIGSPGEKDLLFNTAFSLKEDAGKQKAEISLQVNKLDGLPSLMNDFQLKVSEGGKNWYKEKVQTRLNGSFDFNFDIPDKVDPNKLTVSLQTTNRKQDNPIYLIPLVINRPENIDLQFMPEGGYMVAGLDAHIAFKALAEDGNGTNVAGVVYDSKQQEVATFKSTHSGIGSFNFCPLSGEIYTAKIKLPNGSLSKAYPLPQVKPSGLVLNVVNMMESDSLEINIAASVDLQATNPVYYLAGQARGVGCFGAIIRLRDSKSKIKVSKTAFPTGISRLTLFNNTKQPLNERIVYIDHNDHLRINVSTDKPFYTKRDSVGMEILVTDKEGKPVQGSFSIAVTDDSQVKIDSLKLNSLKSALLLADDLKGNIESPEYYFQSPLTNSIWHDLDNLLLTQGWVSYNWETVFTPLKPFAFPEELNFSVKGKVSGIFKPSDKANVILLSKKPSFVMDTTTDKTGVFNFTNLYPSDTAVYFIQTRNKRGKSFNVGIDVNEFIPPVIAPIKEKIIPWYVNIDSSKRKTVNNYLAFKNEHDKKQSGIMLKEVKINDKKIIPGSKNLNGPGESDFALNEEDIRKEGKATLGDLLERRVKGFRLGGKNPNLYYLFDQHLHFIIDGIDIDFVYSGAGGPIGYREFVKGYLDYYSAEDIKGIEVMQGGTGFPYTIKFIDPRANPFEHAWVEVTTYSGKGPFFNKTPGTYLYRPLAFDVQKQFYSPKYKTKDDNTFADVRSTIYWSPNIFTDKNGKAKRSFYTADKPGTYTVLLNGCDMNGNLESIRQKITIK